MAASDGRAGAPDPQGHIAVDWEEQRLKLLAAFDQIALPAGIRSRFVNDINGLTMHMLEAGFERSDQTQDQPCVLLLHGFPELAYSWRKVMQPIAQAGFHVIAPDQRGYGRITGWDADYDGDFGAFRMLNLVRDALGLVSALGYRSVAAVVGHDFGSPVAAWCALVRPDVFRSVVLMSAPFAGPPPLPFDTANHAPNTGAAAFPAKVLDDLAALQRPRKHYQWCYSTSGRGTNRNARCCWSARSGTGLAPQAELIWALVRGYFGVLSGFGRP